ncbi:hypothetical protein GIB67_005526 [Kingdonia uniflora]|uniref:Lunapark zinc ribbon domain-containing protein n=1 Tax=Kingdonia uniflora TaxID=39325 RepID=A0A7J7NI53_9MAGN|nr:hypothetical protein GIB67_005526 [Kingdonia uniflora]
MADDDKQSQAQDVVVGENPHPTTEGKKEGEVTKKQKKGVISRIWNGLFRVRGDDFEKRLQYITKEEASVLARIKTRSLSWRTGARNLIVFSVLLEIIAVGYAVMTTRSLHLDWKMRALRVLPMFLLPAISTLLYSTLMSFTKMRDRKDQKTLERLRAERLAKINELKERTNYYITQQLIQRYDPDPAAKAAAATVLASKLGADSGLKVYLGEESKRNPQSGKSNDVEYAQSKGLRNRKQSHTRSNSAGSLVMESIEETTAHDFGSDVGGSPMQNQPVVVDHHPRSTVHDGGWIARVAALLVGEDPTQSYALICGNCHMHNGLARKEDFPFITYYCPHCNALNKSKQLEDNSAPIPGSSSVSSPATPSSADAGDSLVERKLITTSSDVTAAVVVPTTGGDEDEVSEEMVN